MTSYNNIFAGLLSRLSDAMARSGEPMKARAYKKAEETILGFITEIKSVEDIKDKPAIGKAIVSKLQEYMNTGKIRILEEAENKPERVLTDVYGIGPKKAKELVKQGITDIDTLRERQNEVLNEVQKKGLIYYEDILKRIPRAEIEEYNKIFKKMVPKGAYYEIVGSYRRGLETSGDIDVIIGSSNPANFDIFLDKLIQDKIIVEVLSRGKNKCLVVAKSPQSNTFRRVDFLYSTPEEYPFSILYFTGSKGFNAVMRGYALTKGYSLNEHGFTVVKKDPFHSGPFHSGPFHSGPFHSEKDIFDFLGLVYKMPKERIDGRAVEEILRSISTIQPDSEEIPIVPPVKKTRKKREPKVKKVKSLSTISAPIQLEAIDYSDTISAPIQLEASEIIPIVKKEIKSRKKREPKVKKEKSLSPILVPVELERSEIVPIVKKEKGSRKKKEKQHIIEPIELDVSRKHTMKKREPKREKKDIKLSPSEKHMIPDIVAQFKSQGLPVIEKLNKDTLSEIIKYANDAYYNEKPVLSDNEFDIIKEFLEKRFPEAEVLQEVGAPIQGKNKVTLPFEMASMDKIKPDSGALPGWTAKYTGPYVLSCKLDGVSGLYVCDSAGKYRLYTRGNGHIGQDVSHLITVLKLPKMKRDMAVRGEFIIPKSIFQNKYAETFANARNMVSGIINRKSTDEKARDLHFVTYEVVQPSMVPSDQMKTLEKTGFETVMNRTIDKLSNEFLSALLLEWRKDYLYEIDGVIVTNDAIYPRGSGNPDHAFAFKMVISDQVAEAKVVDVLWEASKDGYLKPRVRIEPIQLGGVTIEYATGFNGKFIEENKIGVGAVIMMVRSGDVIPYIQSVSVPAEKAKMPGVSYIWNKTKVDILLENPDEDETVQEKNVTAFFVSLEVDGLAKGNVKKLFKKGHTTVADIIKMSVADFEQVEGFKTKTAEKIHKSIQEKVQQASLLTIMVASGKLGRGLGERKIKPILEKYPDIVISTIPTEQKESMLQEVAGIGKENAREFVKNIPEFLEFVKECGLDAKLRESVKTSPVVPVSTGHTLFGKKIVMTKVRDKEIIDFLEKVGASLEDNMKKDVAVLIVKLKEDVSNKTEYAQKNGIPMMTPDEFKKKYM